MTRYPLMQASVRFAEICMRAAPFLGKDVLKPAVTGFFDIRRRMPWMFSMRTPAREFFCGIGGFAAAFRDLTDRIVGALDQSPAAGLTVQKAAAAGEGEGARPGSSSLIRLPNPCRIEAISPHRGRLRRTGRSRYSNRSLPGRFCFPAPAPPSSPGSAHGLDRRQRSARTPCIVQSQANCAFLPHFSTLTAGRIPPFSPASRYPAEKRRCCPAPERHH